MPPSDDEKIFAKLQYFYDLMKSGLDHWEKRIIVADSEERKRLMGEFLQSNQNLCERYHELFSGHIIDDEEA